MKISSLVKCALAFLFGALVATPHLASAQTTNVIFNYTNQTWAFHARATAPSASNWKDPGFTPTLAAGWSNGFGVFSTAPHERLPTAATNAGASVKTTLSTNGTGGYVTTYYFRTTFNFAGDVNGVNLIVSNILDDGAVFYLNGIEMQRIRIPDGQVSNTTFANGNVEAANLNDTFTVAANNLVQGVNTLAVELHQTGPVAGFNSPDAVFGLALSAILPQLGPVVITRQPGSAIINEGANHTFSVEAQGTPPLSYQWFKDGQEIQFANSSTYTITGANSSHVGNYTVRVSNQESFEMSSEVFLRVNFAPPAVLTNEWRYLENGVDQGTAWRGTNFNDSSWKVGKGILALESNTGVTPINTVLSLTNASGAQNITYYFRRNFNFSGDPSIYTLRFNFLVDDGMVVYLNGQELFRYNMPGGAITYATVANEANPAGEAVFVVTNTTSELLVEGVNTLAVEVHQNSPTSSDIVFGMEAQLVLPPPTALSFIKQPADALVEEGHPVQFRAEVSGGQPTFQWYKGNNPIPGATRSFLNLDYPLLADATNYYVVVSNAISRITSRQAILQVIPDTNGPALVSAMMDLARTNITITFNERITPETATNRLNYAVRLGEAGPPANITRVIFENGTNVILTVSPPLQSGTNYVLVVNNIRDISPNTNVITAESKIPIGATIKIIPWTAGWKFYSYGDGEQGADWKALNFNELDNFGEPWPGPNSGAFANDVDELPVISNTRLSIGVISYYFRNSFVLNASPAGAQLILRTLIDDGAVFYLNGTEILRLRMPVGTPTEETLATPSVGNASIEGPFLIPLEFLRPGTNVLAVEVHQSDVISSDVVFGLELDAVVSSFIGGTVSITQSPTNRTVVEGERIVLGVQALGGSTFQWFRNDSPISGANNATFVIDPVTFSHHNARYKVAVSNATSGAISSNATITVIADTNRPTIVSVTGPQTNEVIINFSERIDPATAQVLQNYTITNALGQGLSILSAVVSNGTTVVLRTSARSPELYTVRVRNVTDLAQARNPILPNSGGTIGGSFVLVPFAATWRYNQSGGPQPPNWLSNSFNDSSWPTGPGAFGRESADVMDVPIQTTHTIGSNQPAYYYRYSFVPAGNLAGGTLTIRYILDDGGIFYLNGAEVSRIRMPTGAITNTTYATGGPGTEGAIEGPITVTQGFVAGTNVLAAEVHQNNATSSDVVFALELSVSYPSTLVEPPMPPNPPAPVSAFAGPNRITLAWNTSSGNTGYNVKRSTTSGSGYETIAAAISSGPYNDTNVTAGVRYYYVITALNNVGESANSVEVTAIPNATIPVAPTGLTATAGTNPNRISLSWNASAGATNYIIRRSTISGTAYSPIATNASTTFVDTTAAVNVPYFYVVAAVNSAGTSANSTQATATITGGPVEGPRLTITRTNSNITINWPYLAGDRLERTPTLVNPVWTTITSNVPPPFSTNAASSNAFFRVRR